MAIDPSTLEWGYRSFAGTDSGNQKATYSLNFTSGGQDYTFIPTSVVNKGVDAGENNYVLPWFLNQDNMGALGKSSQYVDLAGQSWYGDYLKDTIGASTTGFLIPTGSLPFDSQVTTTTADVKGIAQTEDGPSYILDSQGSLAKYIKPDGKVTTWTKGSSILGDVFGSVGEDLAGSFNEALSSINELGPWANAAISIAYPPAGAAIAAANAAQGAMTGAAIEDVALNAAKAALLSQAGDGLFGGEQVGSATGPDNIDIGGGWSPAAGATAAELEAARAALEVPTAESITQSIEAPVYDYAEPTAPTAETITQDIAANAPDNIDIGGGWSPAAGATDAQMAAARAAMASTGWTFSQALDAVRAGLLVNAITGDPLNLSGSQGTQADAPTGFSIVPVPTEWKPPEYAASSAPIDLSTIFSNQNMLGGTQWQNLPNQQNVSFNDIFSAGQQQTPMGTPVDINQIVSSILGQAATSQKPA